jgi:hypothetical protein
MDAAKELKASSEQSAFGFTAMMAIEIYMMMNLNSPIPFGLIIACIAAVGQVKSNLSTNELMRKIEDVFDLSTNDKVSNRSSVNFSAVRLIGMLYCYEFGSDGGISILKKLGDKAGNVWDTESSKFPDTEAGNINKALKDAMGNYKIPSLSPAVKTEIINKLRLFYSESAGGYDTETKKKLKDKLKTAMARPST